MSHLTALRLAPKHAGFALAAALLGCNDRRQAPAADARSDAAVAHDASRRDGGLEGVSNERLMQLYGYGDAGVAAAASDHPRTDEHTLEPDGEFDGARPVSTVRARFTIALPDEHATVATERTLVLDDQGDRAWLQLVGAGLPAVPGIRVAARAGLAGFALVSAAGERYRVAPPDDVQQWFLGAGSGAGTTVAFRRTDQTIVATRGGLSLTIATDRDGPIHPLACRAFVALALGGDPQAARVGCETARLPARITLRAHGWTALVIERTGSEPIELPRAALAVPPHAAAPTLAAPTHESTGAFFAPTELAALGAAHRAQDVLTVTNAMDRSALVLVDDLAIGWIDPGATGAFVGLGTGHHAVRGRSLDGLDRSRATPVTLPATVRLETAPELR